jgi:hypothetical protein
VKGGVDVVQSVLELTRIAAGAFLLFHYQYLLPGLGQESTRGQSTNAPSYNDNIICAL